MNTSGEAADQVMRMMLNGAEVLIKLSGSGAKNAAVLLYSIAREQKKTKGAARLESMLRSGKPLKVYTFRDSDLPKFKEVAKQYGILYTVLKEKDKTGGVFDVMVRAEDESKIARITERFNLARVNTADLRAEIIREKEEAEKDEGKTDVPETDKPEKSADEKLADEILGKPIQKEENEMENPTAARTETTR
ncbi:MAG: PcfB family protein, partial [Clostridia bacterium]|nr:PcfB family protein [Clostridia bacterium]